MANKIFDVAVNMGETIANRFLQQSLNSLGKPQVLKVDGIVGSNTLVQLNNCSEEEITNVLEYSIILQKHHYLELVKNRPDQHIFLKGWFNRADK